MGDELPLTVRLSAITDHMQCPVCMCNLKDTTFTACGHRFCERCIRECINQHHKCPCCNKKIDAKSLTRDPQFDQLVSIVVKESELSEKDYFDNLINKAGTADGGAEIDNPQTAFSPVEDVLKKHLKKSLVSHETYHQKLLKDLKAKEQRIEMEYNNRREIHLTKGLSDTELDAILTELDREKSNELKRLEDEVKRCGDLVAEAYDKYLEAHIPDLSVLPISVSFHYLHSNILFEDIILEPTTSLDELKARFTAKMQEKGDSIVEMKPEVRFISFGPFSKTNLFEMTNMARDMVELGAEHHDIHIIRPHSQPVVELGLKPGTVIVIYGKVKCESDMPKKCFIKTFNEHDIGKVDYFTCRTCNFKWICRSCMEVCHAEHDVKPYILGHQPTWACCYCPKKKTCRIINN